MKRIVKFLSVLSVSLLVTTGAYGADLYAHYDASISATVTPPTGVVTDLADISTNGFDAGADVGTVLYPDSTPSSRNLDLLDMGAARNTLSTLTEVQQQDLLNFDVAAAGNDGFAFFVVARVDALFPTNSIIRDVILANRGDITAGLHLRLQGASPELYVGGVKAEDTSAVPVAGDTLVIAANYNKVTGDLEFWNSKANATVTVTVPAGDFSQPNPIFLGGSTNSDQFLDGAIGEVKFYQGKLTTAQFAAEQGLLVEKWRETDPFITNDRIVNAELFAPIADFQITTSTDVTDPPVSYAETGLPSGLTLDTVTGLITGTPSEVGEFNVDLSATNSSVTITSVLVLTVTSPVSPTVEMTSPTDGSDIAYGSTVILSARPIAVAGGDLTVTYFLEQPLPDPDINLGTADASTEYALDWVVNELGTLTFYAVVEEVGVGQSAVPPLSSSTVTSVVADNLPSAMITSITNTIPRTRVESGSVVLLRADVTGENGDTNDVDSVQFFVNGAEVSGPVTRLPDSSIYELEWVPSLVGDADQLAATIVAVVTSQLNGISVSSSPVFVDVITSDTPVVNFITPTGDVEIQANQELDLLASATVVDGTISEVQFFYRNTPGNPLSGTSGNLIGTDASTPYSAIFSRPSEGTYYVYAVATSTAGRTGFTTAPIKVTVVPGVAPTVGDVQSPVDTVTLGSTLPLSITAGDSDGTIASVDFYNGGVLLGAGTLNGTTTYTLNWTPTVEGTYSITAVATDDTGLIAESAVKTITVTANAAPTVGNVQVPVGTVTLGNTVTLSVIAGDSDGSVASVNFYNGSVLLGAGALSGGNTYTLAWTPDTVTTYNVTAIATDNHGLDSVPSAIATTVTVADNAAPTVGNVQVPVNTVTLGNTVTLSVIAGDSDGSVASVNFYNGSVLLGAGALSGGTTYTLAWTPDTVTTYNVTAIATDNHGLDSVPSAIATTVTVAANTAPTVGNVQVPVNTVTLGNTVTLSVIAGDSDGSVASVNFYNGSVLLGAGALSGGNTYTLAWTPDTVTTYNVTAIATDNHGLDSGPSAIATTVTVAANTAPTVGNVQSPVDTVTLGSTLPLSITADDSDGTVAGVDFYNGGVLLGSLTTAASGTNYVYNWTPTAVGTYSITAVATDDLGLIAESAVKTITVVAAVGLVPTADISLYPPVAGAEERFVTGSQIAIYVNALDDDGSIASSAIYVDGSLLPGNGSTAVYIPPTGGFKAITAVVVDNDGNVASSSITIRVIGSGPRPSVSIDSPVVDQVFYLGDDVVVRASVDSAGLNVDTIFVLQDGRLIEVQGSGLAVAPDVYEFTVPQADVQNDIEFRVGASYNISYQVLVGFNANGSPQFQSFDFAKVGLSEPVTIDVLAGAAPEVAITGFTDGDKLAFGSTIAVPIRVTPLDSSSTMSVELFADGVSQGSATSAPYLVNYPVDQTGTIELYAVATETLPDNSTATRRSATVRLIGAVGQAPVVSPVQVPVNTVTLGNTVTLSVTAGDTDGTIQSLDFYSDGVLLGAGALSSGNTYTLAWTPSAAGTYNVTAIAVDNEQFVGISPNATPVTVAANTAPTVGNVQVPVGTVTLGNTVTLSVIAGDSDGSVASVNFYNGSVLLGAGALSGGNTYTLAWTPDTVTTYNVTAIATDNHGLDSGPSAIATTVTVAANTAPTVGNVQVPVSTVTLGNTVTLSVTAGDSDGSVASVNFYNGGVLLGAGALSNGTTYTLDWTPDTLGAYNVTAIATDNHGLDSGPSANATAVTVAANAAPTVGDVQSAVDTVTLGSTLPLSITAGDSDGTVAGVDFYNGGVLLGAGALSSGTTYTLDWTPSAAGTYSITAVATDDRGLIAESAVKTITVVAAVGLVPSVDISLYPSVAGAQARFVTGSQIAIYVNALDEDGSIASSALYVDGSLLAGNGSTAVYIPSTEGSKVIAAVAVDNDGNVASSSITVNVVGSGPRPSVSIESPVVDQVFYLGDDVVVRALVDSTGLNVDTIFLLQDGRLIEVQGSGSAVAPGVYEFTVPQADVQNDIEFRVGASYNISYQVFVGFNANGSPQFQSFDFAKVGLSEPVTIDVLAGAAPEVAITGFTDGDKLAFGSTIAVPIRVTPLDSSSTMSVELFADGVSQGVAPSASAPYLVNYPVDQTGTIELYAVATETLPDNSTATRRSATVRLIGAVGQAPVVSPVQVPVNTVTLGNTVTLSVTAGDTDGTIQSLDFYSDGVLLGAGALSSGNTYTLAWTPSAAGTYALTAIAVDNEQLVGISANATSVTVVANAAPTVSDVQVSVSTVTLGNTVTLSVTAGDSDGTVAGVDFYNGSVLLGAGALSGGTTYTLDWTPDTLGAYNVTAIATDNHGLDSGPSANATSVTVVANAAPTVSDVQVSVSTVTLGNTVTLSVTAGDSDGSVASVNFYNGGVLLGAGALSGGATYTLDWTPDAVTTYNVTAIATDNYGLNSAPSASATTVTVVAPAPIVDPTVSFVSPIGDVELVPYEATTGDGTATGGDEVAPEGATVTLRASATVVDGTISQVEFFYLNAPGNPLLGTSIGVDTSSPYTTVFSSGSVGTYYIYAVATSNTGGIGVTTESIQVTVAEPVEPVVTFVAPTAGDVVEIEARETLTLLASAEVEGGTISGGIRFYFRNTPGDPLLGTLIESVPSAPYTTEFVSLSEGVFYLYAVATSFERITGVTATPIEVRVTYSQDELFINNIFDSILGRSPTDSEVADGLDELDGSLESQTAYVVDLLDSSALDDTYLAMLVNRTMLGEWPDAEELAFARANLSGGTVGSSIQTGSIEFGATETFEFFYNVGDAVTMRVTQDSAAGNPLRDATLTVNSPSGAQVGFSDDSIFGLDPLLTFTVTEAGTHTAIVGGFSLLQSGDFTITSLSTGSGSSNDASAQSLVTALIPEFESRFRETFPPLSITGQAANNLVTQLFRNKHSTAPSALALSRLSLSLTGADTNLGQLIVPGYSGTTAAFVAAFALDNQLSQYPGLSSVLYYTVPNDATEDMQTALLIATLLEEDPTDTQIAEYAGMTNEEVVEAILIESLEPSASTWTPVGWVYYNYPYAYSLDEARWHYFDSSNTQWRVNLTTSEWGTLPEATGWTFYAWPYSYSVDASTWYWYNDNEQWVVDLVSGIWALFGD